MAHIIDSCYFRACERALQALGYEPSDDGRDRALSDKDAPIVAMLPAPARYAVWLLDSLLVGLRAANKGDAILALRCAFQACDYVGRTGRGWPSPNVSDAWLTLRNWLEDALRPNEPALRLAREIVSEDLAEDPDRVNDASDAYQLAILLVGEPCASVPPRSPPATDKESPSR